MASRRCRGAGGSYRTLVRCRLAHDPAVARFGSPARVAAPPMAPAAQVERVAPHSCPDSASACRAGTGRARRRRQRAGSGRAGVPAKSCVLARAAPRRLGSAREAFAPRRVQRSAAAAPGAQAAAGVRIDPLADQALRLSVRRVDEGQADAGVIEHDAGKRSRTLRPEVTPPNSFRPAREGARVNRLG
jgi:hypothetical protein